MESLCRQDWTLHSTLLRTTDVCFSEPLNVNFTFLSRIGVDLHLRTTEDLSDSFNTSFM